MRIYAQIFRGDGVLHDLKTRITAGVFILNLHVVFIVTFVVDYDGLSQYLLEFFLGIIIMLSSPFNELGKTLAFDFGSGISP